MSLPPGLPPEKKGLSCLAMGGIGCLAIFVALFVGGGVVIARFFPQIKVFAGDFQKDPERTTFLLLLKANPKIEVVSEDTAKRELTFKSKGQDETYTINFNDLKEANQGGMLKVRNSKGEVITLDPRGGELKVHNSEGEVIPLSSDAPAQAVPTPPN
jgi:hypothetical protein